jgi:hypothetical protein
VIQLLLLVSGLQAEQLDHDVDKSGSRWSFETRWEDGDGDKHRIQYTLPAAKVKQDLDVPLQFQAGPAYKDVAREVEAWGEGVKGAQVSARGSRRGVQISVSSKQGRKKMKQTLKQATQARDEAFEDALAQQGFTLLKGGVIPDHVKHVRLYSDDVAPLVKALGGPTKDPRVFGEKALSMVQSIPYERSGRKRDKYRRPLSVLGRNKGDCDSKATLFLALMRAAYPDMEMGIVYIEGHAFVALGIDDRAGDTTLRHGGRKWVLAEPVGPAMMPIGEVARKSRRRAKTGRYTLRTLG